ncbi:sulfotransferase family protein [Paracoccus pantotrophus]|uniref:Sulfotransferase family protein n=2 Tax=Paracoccus TaxID=265 RepID=A0AAE6NU69_PARPN|nr:sulfotransferase family 2 domain-containing protein [Paracoccus pantotrophus]QFG36190.1 sulfotransferase family protein [Paracoccus pantotrophus]RKS43237.1 sulfotransferase family protein [Paracoccus pantotrophus]RNI15163.1 hypothetical protein EB844_17925 [Paracoccus pantotrophus]
MPFIQHNGKRILFIHIPKAGGTSVESWMKGIAPLRLFSMGIPHASRCTPQHYRAQDIEALLGEGFFDYAFTIVRNPYHRIESEYRMRAQLAKDSFWKGLPAFSPWVEENLDLQRRAKFHLDNHLRPQWEFLGKDVEVFKLEDGLAAPLAAVAERLGVAPPQQNPHELRSDPLEIEWSPADRIRVRDHYARDFETFGYQP